MKKIIENMKLNWDIINEYENKNLISINKHNELDLFILNYTPKVQYEKLWDNFTLICRGLVVNKNGNIIARPFKKFFNLEEIDDSKIDLTKPFDVFEKFDGSLIILFNYLNNWIISTRGSFNSNQANYAKDLIKKSGINLDLLNKNYTYLFEIIYPENRIVIDYGNVNKLILLAAIDTNSEYELTYYELKNLYNSIFKNYEYFDIVKKIEVNNIKNLYELKLLEEKNKEGFVIKFINNERIKIKFNEYIKLHYILTNITDNVIWKMLKDNIDIYEIIKDIPDETYQLFLNKINNFKLKFLDIENEILKEFIKLIRNNELNERKKFAIEANKSKYSKILFLLYDNKNYDYLIWNLIKPQNNNNYEQY